MSNYQDYKQARDKAWKVLIECQISELPVRLSTICGHYGWELVSYKRGMEIIKLLGLSGLMTRTDGFCTITQRHVYIFFDSSLSVGRQRFTVAHEIGHIILGHVGPGFATTQNREPKGTESLAERQANMFAARLLAPACVLHEIRAITPEQIQEVCGISLQSAQFRAERMKELELRNCYYTSPLEQKVLEQFNSYILRFQGR